MAMVCCERHGAPRGVRHKYVANVKPLGYPNKAVLCCRGDCSEPGVVWLNEEDKANYDSGERAIVIGGHSVKVKVM